MLNGLYTWEQRAYTSNNPHISFAWGVFWCFMMIIVISFRKCNPQCVLSVFLDNFQLFFYLLLINDHNSSLWKRLHFLGATFTLTDRQQTPQCVHFERWPKLLSFLFCLCAHISPIYQRQRAHGECTEAYTKKEWQNDNSSDGSTTT